MELNIFLKTFILSKSSFLNNNSSRLVPDLVISIAGKILLAIPCHRVIRSDGNLGGFSAKGGIKLKKKLLEFEKT